MKNQSLYIISVIFLILISCKKKHTYLPIKHSTLSQKFEVKGNQDTTIQTQNGTILRLSAGCFIDSGVIKIQVEEYTKFSDILLKGLNTKTDSGILETAGMFHISAFNEQNESLQLDTSKPIKVYNPTIDSSYTIFHRSKEDSTDWENRAGKIVMIQPLGWTIKMMDNHMWKMYRERSMLVFELGWINFDKLLPCEKTNLIVYSEGQTETMKLKLKGYNTVINEFIIPKEGDISKFQFSEIPKDVEGVLICFGINPNGKYYYNFIDISTSQKEIHFPLMKEVESKKELIDLLEEKCG